MTPEQKIKKNEKARKEKFLDDYFSLCREHGFCADRQLVGSLYLADWPSYAWSKVLDPWSLYKKELRDSI